MQQKVLSNLEQQVMDIIWKHKQCTVRNVLQYIKRDLAYTTVATLLQRLHAKGFVTRRETRNGFIYLAKFSKESYSKNVAQNFLKKFIHSFGDTGIASFAESIDTLPQQKRDYFLKLLNDYDKNQ